MICNNFWHVNYDEILVNYSKIDQFLENLTGTFQTAENIALTLQSTTLPEKLTFPQPIKKSPSFMEPESSSPLSQQLTTLVYKRIYCSCDNEDAKKLV